MPTLVCFSDPFSSSLVELLTAEGYRLEAVSGTEEIRRLAGLDAPDGAVVSSERGLEAALSFCRRFRALDERPAPVLLLADPAEFEVLEAAKDLFDDVASRDASGPELVFRAHRLFLGSEQDKPGVISYGPLALNLETYQAAVAGRPLDLTYMEYELLRYLASHPGRVFTREALLSRVWGYEYFGGARTVDVHVRRLRAKLGEEHAHLIETVRSVGYRFGSSRWLSSPRG